MRIDALKLLDGPIVVDVDESAHVLQTEDEPIFQFLEGIKGRVVFTRMLDGKVLVRGALTTRVQAHCVRCLEPVELALSAEVTLVYASDPDLLDEKKRMEFPDEIVYFDGHLIEPLNDLRELLLLELPAYPSCELIPGRRCGFQPRTFGAPTPEAGKSPQANSEPSRRESSEAPGEPEWKAALRRVSDSRNPTKS